MKQDWKALMTINAEFAKERLLRDGTLHPLAILHTRGPDLVVMPLSCENQQQKQSTWDAIRIASIAYDAIAIALMVEAWMTTPEQRSGETKAEMRERVYAVPPSESEQRVEIISIHLTYRDDDGEQRRLVRLEEILRDDDAKPIGFKSVRADDEASQAEGAMMTLLHDFHPSDEQRTLARAVLAGIGTIEKMTTRH